jgi:tetratricopeptide (TPR) repeat protein
VRTWLRTPSAARDATLVAAVALLVRVVYLLQAARGPAFAEPLVDAQYYHDLAAAFGRDGIYDARMLWQACLYPALLGRFYDLVGVSVIAARWAQSLLGLATVLLTWAAARRALSPAAGLVAGLIVALNGVLVFFEAELLGAGLAALWAALLLWLLLPTREDRRPWRLAATGAVGALALLTRPDLLPPALVGWAWLVWPRGPGRILRIALPVLAALAVLIPMAAYNHGRTGHAGLLPPSGGVNLYLGNNPRFDETITIRPGLPWEALLAAPARETRTADAWVNERWFRARVLAYLRDDPAGFAAGLARKTLHALSSRELTRNVDIYLFRQWSPLLAALVSKAGPFGFPMGLLLPAAAAGLVLGRRRLPQVVWLVPAASLATLALVFVASRYRVVVVPWLALPAAWAAVDGWRRLRSRAVRPLAPAALAFVATLLITTLPGPFAQERIDTAPEIWHGIGYNRLHRDHDLAGAEAAFRQAVALRPDYPEAHNRLGVVLAQQGRLAESIPHFEAAIAAWPDYPEARRNLAEARRLAAPRTSSGQ